MPETAKLIQMKLSFHSFFVIHSTTNYVLYSNRMHTRSRLIYYVLHLAVVRDLYLLSINMYLAAKMRQFSYVVKICFQKLRGIDRKHWGWSLVWHSRCTLHVLIYPIWILICVLFICFLNHLLCMKLIVSVKAPRIEKQAVSARNTCSGTFIPSETFMPENIHTQRLELCKVQIS